jgi:SAM-dependent methyltransferase
VDRSGATTDADPARSRSADLYDALAPIYDEWQEAAETVPFALVTSAKLGPRLERLARDGAFSFLDVGCGTGLLLSDLRLAHPAWTLAGLDASAGMLAIARRRPGAETITWARAALSQPLPFGRRFDAAGAFYDTLNHTADPIELRAACACVARALRPGGAFVFDVTNRLGFDRWWRGTRRFTSRRWRLTIDTAFDGETGLASVSVEREGMPARQFRLVERLFSDAEVTAALRAAGFTVESREPWSPFEMDVAGKTWWTASRESGGSGPISAPDSRQAR